MRATSRGLKCRHCRKGSMSRPRGLCWTCYYQPAVRDLYPVVSNQYGKPRTNDFCGGYKLPEEPTKARPGSAEKAVVLASRAERKVALFHPDDFAGE